MTLDKVLHQSQDRDSTWAYYFTREGRRPWNSHLRVKWSHCRNFCFCSFGAPNAPNAPPRPTANNPTQTEILQGVGGGGCNARPRRKGKQSSILLFISSGPRANEFDSAAPGFFVSIFFPSGVRKKEKKNLYTFQGPLNTKTVYPPRQWWKQQLSVCGALCVNYRQRHKILQRLFPANVYWIVQTAWRSAEKRILSFFFCPLTRQSDLSKTLCCPGDERIAVLSSWQGTKWNVTAPWFCVRQLNLVTGLQNISVYVTSRRVQAVRVPSSPFDS